MSFITKAQLREEITALRNTITNHQTAADLRVESHLRGLLDDTKRVSEAEAKARLDTLQLVIDALEIKGYSPASGLYDSLIGSTNSFKQELIAERDSLHRQHLLRFEQDLRTALEVRATAKRKAAEEATEAKVAGLFKPEPKPTYGLDFGLVSTFGDGGYISAKPVVADDISDEALERILKAVKEFDQPVPRPTAKPKKAKGA